ncbi:hypothetical protein FJZ19_00700 [Candidatus Pacearchaeota archaeon]|nr:hypothetical protein [Candidatus Pacearchaeota archaeon]
MAREHDAKSYLSESFLGKCFENSSCFKLMIADKGHQLDEEGLRDFLDEFEDKEDVINLLKELNKSKLLLPDFILKDDEGVFFSEIKTKSSENKVKLSDIPQKYAIKKLAAEGFEVWVIIDRTDWGEKSEQEIIEILEESGKFDKKVYPEEDKVNVNIKMDILNERKVEDNIYMADVEITDVEKLSKNI